MARVLNVCISEEKGLQKKPVESVKLVKGFGIYGDAHGGDWHRQVSLLAEESAAKIRAQGVDINPGDFGENILTEGVHLTSLKIGAMLCIGNAQLEVTQIGKECHTRCVIYDTAGTCVMPTEGIFCRVIRGGIIRPDDEIIQENNP